MPRHTPTEVHGFSRAFHALDSLTSRAGTSAAVLLLVIISVTAIAISGFTSTLEYQFATVASAITLVMVFVIQHTQNRRLLALQIKIDELVRALPQADDRFVHVEAGSDDELQELEERLVDHRAAVRQSDTPD